MKKINKVIAAMMIMAITSVPALANNKVDKKPGKDKDKMEMRLFDKKKSFNHHAYRADIKTVTFKVSTQHQACRELTIKQTEARPRAKLTLYKEKTGGVFHRSFTFP